MNRKKSAKILSIIIALLITISGVSLPAFAAELPNGSVNELMEETLTLGLSVDVNQDSTYISEEPPAASVLDVLAEEMPQEEESVERYVSTRIESNDMTLNPKVGEQISNSKYDLTEYGFAENPSYPTAFHALIYALEGMGLDSKDPDVLKHSGGWLTSICGLGDSYEGFWMYAVDGKVGNDALAEYPLKEGDSLLFFFVTNWAEDYLAHFDSEEMAVAVGQSLTITLKGESIYDITYNNPLTSVAISGARLLVSDEGTISADNPTASVTNAMGQATISFDSPGVYLLSAVGETHGITRPYCKITVTEGPPAITDADIVAQDKQSLSLGDLSNITQNILLPTSGAMGSTITWASSNESVIAVDGRVNRPASGQADATVTLTARILKGGFQDTKSFAVTVLAIPYQSNNPTSPQSLLDNGKGYFDVVAGGRLNTFWDIGAVKGAWGGLANYTVADYTIKPAENTPSEYAGQILAMLALGMNPATDCQENLVATLVAMQGTNGKFSTLPNQHIWATIALSAQGAAFNREGAVAAILSLQSSNGAIEGEDITGMALIALSANRDIHGVDAAISKAVGYFKTTQLKTGALAGGWGDNANTLASVISGLVAAGEDVTSATWSNGVNNPVQVLALFANNDGGFKLKTTDTSSNALATSQAIIAIRDVISGNSLWFDITQPTSPLPATDKTALKAGIDYAQNIDSGKYTTASFQKLATALTKAKLVYQDAFTTQADVNSALLGVNAAIYSLVEKGGETANPSVISVNLTVTGNSNMGTILDTNLEIKKNGTAFDTLKTALDAAGIAYRYSGGSSSVYIKSINGLSEFAEGANSGWMYSVNGTNPGISCGAKTLKQGDSVLFYYTSDYSKEESFSEYSYSGTAKKETGSGSLFENAPMTQLAGLKTTITKTTADYKALAVLSDWEALSLVAAGEKIPDSKLKEILKAVKASGGKYTLATDAARTALLLQLAGKDITNIEGVNLLKAVYNNKDMGRQGLNGYIFSLMVMSNAKEIPTDAAISLQKVRDSILAAQNTDGGFALSVGGKSNLDITAMAVTALAPYKGEAKAKTAIDNAVTYMATKQLSDGSFSYNGVKSSETISQVIIALCANGISPDDARFVTNGKSLISTLLEFKSADGKFAHIKGEASDAIATEQGLLALQSYVASYELATPIYKLKPVSTTPPKTSVK